MWTPHLAGGDRYTRVHGFSRLLPEGVCLDCVRRFTSVERGVTKNHDLSPDKAQT